MKYLATTIAAFAAVAALAVPASAATHVHPSYRDTNWPCAGC